MTDDVPQQCTFSNNQCFLAMSSNINSLSQMSPRASAQTLVQGLGIARIIIPRMIASTMTRWLSLAWDYRSHWTPLSFALLCCVIDDMPHWSKDLAYSETSQDVL